MQLRWSWIDRVLRRVSERGDVDRAELARALEELRQNVERLRREIHDHEYQDH